MIHCLGSELSNFRAICCEIGGFHFSLFKSKNGRRISRNLPKWRNFKTLGGYKDFWYIVNNANGADFATFTF